MTDSRVWLLIVGVAGVTYLIKGFGPAVVGDRELPERFNGVIGLLASALLAALVVTSAFVDDRGPSGGALHVGADTAGVTVAGLLLWLRAPLLVVVVGAAVVAGGLRALGWDT